MDSLQQKKKSIIYAIFVYLFLSVGIVFLLIGTYRVSELILSYSGVSRYGDNCAYITEGSRAVVIEPDIEFAKDTEAELALREKQCIEREQKNEKNNRAREIRDIVFFLLAGGILLKSFRKKTN
jgi:hypothetical protein